MDTFDQLTLILILVFVTVAYVEFDTLKKLLKGKNNVARQME